MINHNHCHKPKLAQLDPSILRMDSPVATPVVRSLAYTRVISQAPWQTYMVANKLEITEVPGIDIHPGQVEP
ncbi:hypothetical protein [Mastigocladopsis repens]|uniref:hypothetical protein n=1 Tax=Mastigocladopsis repens TaxID=221287 RepID=UPI00031755D7|nr:hypothetical protein [Mastigocladopsis repens]